MSSGFVGEAWLISEGHTPQIHYFVSADYKCLIFYLEPLSDLFRPLFTSYVIWRHRAESIPVPATCHSQGSVSNLNTYGARKPRETHNPSGPRSTTVSTVLPKSSLNPLVLLRRRHHSDGGGLWYNSTFNRPLTTLINPPSSIATGRLSPAHQINPRGLAIVPARLTKIPTALRAVCWRDGNFVRYSIGQKNHVKIH